MESMTYGMMELLSEAELESAMVDTGPKKLHDSAGVGQTSTRNPEEPIIYYIYSRARAH